MFSPLVRISGERPGSFTHTCLSSMPRSTIQCPLGPGRKPRTAPVYLTFTSTGMPRSIYLSISDNLSAGNVRHLSCFHNNVSTNQSQKNNILPALLKYGDGKEHVFSESSSADIQSVLFCILGCTLCIGRHAFKVVKDH